MRRVATVIVLAATMVAGGYAQEELRDDPDVTERVRRFFAETGVVISWALGEVVDLRLATGADPIVARQRLVTLQEDVTTIVRERTSIRDGVMATGSFTLDQAGRPRFIRYQIVSTATSVSYKSAFEGMTVPDSYGVITHAGLDDDIVVAIGGGGADVELWEQSDANSGGDSGGATVTLIDSGQIAIAFGGNAGRGFHANRGGDGGAVTVTAQDPGCGIFAAGGYGGWARWYDLIFVSVPPLGEEGRPIQFVQPGPPYRPGRGGDAGPAFATARIRSKVMLLEGPGGHGGDFLGGTDSLLVSRIRVDPQLAAELLADARFFAECTASTKLRAAVAGTADGRQAVHLSAPKNWGLETSSRSTAERQVMVGAGARRVTPAILGRSGHPRSMAWWSAPESS